jgi:hypothetical protein
MTSEADEFDASLRGFADPPKPSLPTEDDEREIAVEMEPRAQMEVNQYCVAAVATAAVVAHLAVSALIWT